MRAADFISDLPEEAIVQELERQKAALERDRETERRRSAAISQAANLRRDIEKLGGTPVK